MFFIIEMTREKTWERLKEIGIVSGDMPEGEWFLSNANLKKANLRKADLSEVNLREADISEANLKKVNLLEELAGDGGFWKVFAEGVENMEVKKGYLSVTLKE